ncbi:UDP-N-acetylmuramoyl-tripeptide--D-alanyl-D-alanine ligase [Sansalvadorimonas verongulae]|uniref:UDP-N-acetylmuramoyl-tripeptide--D-alanyl-D- alanine ligase n=1 Tax=Sansalvadorimonas verongulae TaxID=2172824 RepID=UPI0012BCEB17|nr:UDP-N-acetylmuramoyl-tripeptide--D-alanyl-D-alanine ligase [Sansalvadorimonas verongulae]MTI15246.1 UDP-N-acetylmuramoyl-tripeptide--D-alanyl-D-alanine ligase [Sansalvadorimonas verongulae]
MIAAENLSSLTSALSGKLVGDDAPVTSISIDTRTLEPGQLFVAIKGPNFDGHNYVQAALDKGAAGVLVSRPVDSFPHILVDDTEEALTQTGILNRKAFKGTVFGVTGSSGKTSVKEMLAAIFSQVAPTLSTNGNFNNAYGVPLTLARLTSEHQFAVIEMGTNSPGEIEHLTNIVQPHISIVNNASCSHVAGLGGLMGVVQEKGAIFDQLPKDGCAVVNLDDEHHPIWLERIRQNAGCRIMTFSHASQEANAWAGDVVTEENGMHFTLHLEEKETPVHLQFWGRHQVTNACAAATIAKAAGLDIETIAAGLGQAHPYARRGQRFRTHHGAMVIDQSYNANSDSTRAAIDELAECDGYRILVMGDLSAEHYLDEEDGIRMHRELGEYALNAGIDRVLTSGTISAHAHTGFQKDGEHFADKSDLITWLQTHLKQGVVALVKGANASGMNKVVSACLSENHEAPSVATTTEGA